MPGSVVPVAEDLGGDLYPRLVGQVDVLLAFVVPHVDVLLHEPPHTEHSRPHLHTGMEPQRVVQEDVTERLVQDLTQRC